MPEKCWQLIGAKLLPLRRSPFSERDRSLLAKRDRALQWPQDAFGNKLINNILANSR